MFKKLLAILFPKKNATVPLTNPYIIAQLNDRIMPIDRGELYENPLDEYLKVKWYGEVSGGGTLQSQNGEIQYCDIEIKGNNTINREAYKDIIAKLEELGAPKGSKLIIEATGEEIPFGNMEGMAVYLDGVNLADEVYESSDPGALAEQINHLIGSNTNIIRHWQGETETALYFYDLSFDKMKANIEDLLSTDPLCKNARVVQIT